jgi:hypothetical protein
MSTPLFQLHKDSRKTFPEVLEFLRQEDPDNCPRTSESVSMILRRGTDRLKVIRALAKAYGKQEAVVEAAALESQRLYRQQQDQRKRERELVSA